MTLDPRPPFSGQPVPGQPDASSWGGQEWAAYLRGNFGPDASPVLTNWRAMLREPLEEVRGVWIFAAAKAIDALHNSGWLAGGVDQACAAINGTGLQLDAQPDMKTLFGWDDAQTAAWKEQTERRFATWARTEYSCDASGRQNLAALARSALRYWFATGEILSTFPYDKRPGNTWGTKVKVLPPSRLTQDSQDWAGLVQGVWLGDLGEPVGYRFREFDPPTIPTGSWIDMDARDAFGRIQALHVFDGDPLQVRGITPMAPALQVTRQFDQIANATATTALIQAIFAATIESDNPTQDLVSALQGPGEQLNFDTYMKARASWYESAKFDLGQFGKVIHLFPGEKFDYKQNLNPSPMYVEFMRFLLREIARCLGITYEMLTNDWTQSSYTSVKMSVSDIWGIVDYRRANILARFYQAAYECWLEEDIEQGGTVIPGGIAAFHANRELVCRAEWRGPAKPSADDLKEAKADDLQLNNGSASLADVCSRRGLDWRRVIDARKAETDYAVSKGMPDPHAPKQGKAAANDPNNPANQDESGFPVREDQNG